jgi:hypothetical protein
LDALQKFDDKHARKREKYVKQGIARTRAECVGASVTLVARDPPQRGYALGILVTPEENAFSRNAL